MAETFGRPNNEGRRLTVGVHTVSLKSVETKETPNGNKYLDLLFAGNDGVASKKIWYPKLDEVKPKENESIEAARQRVIDNFTGDLYVALDAVDAGEVAGKDADDFANKAVSKLRSANAAKCKIVLQYDKDGKWPEFPRYRWATHISMEPDTSKFRMKPEGDTPKKESAINNAGDLF